MKLISTLALASVLIAGSAFAADAPAATSHPAAAASTAAAPDHHCRDDANGRKLTGAARKSFMKKCLADARHAK